MTESRVIGTPFRRVDGRAKVTGETRFADDLSFPRMVFMKMVRATVPHARINHIDLSAARRVDGAVDFLTGEDLPVPYGILPVSHDENALALDKVRFVGEPVVAVAATSEDAADEMARAVRVDYELLETIADAEEALDKPTPEIHERGRGNLSRQASFRFGDVDAGFEAAEMVLEDTFFYDGNTHLPIEQHAAVAVPEDDSRLTLYASTQVPHYLHRTLAKVLGNWSGPLVPAWRIRVIACPNGGGFGGKSDVFNHEIAAAAMALKLGRPVKCTLTRDEVFYCHRGRHPVLMHMRTGFTKDGAMTAQHLRTLLDGGAFGSYGAASTLYTGALQTVTYQLPRYAFDGVRAFTNKPPCGPKRGHGTPQPRFGLEIHLDKAAEKLGMSPAEIRLRNLVEPHAITANWLQLGTVGLGPCIRAVVAGSDFEKRYNQLPPGRGLGLACGSYLTGAGLPINWNQLPQSGVTVQLDRSGGVAVFSGATEIGQGSDSMLAAIVAEVLGVGVDDIHLCVADTALTPVDLGSYSSRVTLMMGNAAVEAAENVRTRLAQVVAEQLGVTVERIGFGGRRVFDIEDPSRNLSFTDAVALAEERFGTLATTGSYKPPRAPGRFRGAGVGPSPTYSYSAAVVEVEVDPRTGIYKIEHIWIGHDIGRSLNPVLVMGQVEGSVYMGLGEAMMEEQVFRRLPRRFREQKGLSGALVHKHPSMLEYKNPTFLEMPEVTTYLIEDPDEKGPFGAKEVGQGPLLPIMPAVANAIYDAVGVRVDQVPIHPHMVLSALQAKAKGKAAHFGPRKFPDVPYGEPLRVPTPDEGGDGRALNETRKKSRHSADGTMPEQKNEEKKHVTPAAV